MQAFGRMIDPKTRNQLEWELMQLAFKYQSVAFDEVVEILRDLWTYAPDLQEHVMRGNIKKTG